MSRKEIAVDVHVFSTFYFLLSTALLPLAADWEVLEPSSAVLQTAAIPSQLPVHEQAVGKKSIAFALPKYLNSYSPNC